MTEQSQNDAATAGQGQAENVESLRISLPIRQSSRRAMVKSFLLVTLGGMGLVLALMSLLYYGFDNHSKTVAAGITLVIFAVLNSFWALANRQGIQTMSGHNEIEIDPYQLRWGNWSLPTHLLRPPRYSQATESSPAGLKLEWEDLGTRREIVLRLFLDQAAYQDLARQLGAYLEQHAEAITRAGRQTLAQAIIRLTPAPSSRLSVIEQNGIPALRLASHLLEPASPEVVLELHPEQLVIVSETDRNAIPWSEIEDFPIKDTAVYAYRRRRTILQLYLQKVGKAVLIRSQFAHNDLLHELVWIQDLLRRNLLTRQRDQT